MAMLWSRQRRMHILGGGWDPSNLSDLSAWYDGQDYSTLYQDSALTTHASNGDVIGGWTDKSGNGYTLTQATTANKPTMTANTINGIAAPRGDGSNDVMSNAALGALFSGNDVPFFVAMVFAQEALTPRMYAWSLGNSGNITPWHALALVETAVELYRIYRYDDAGGNATKSAGSTTTDPVIICQSFTGTTVDIWKNNVKISSSQSLDVGVMTVNQFAIFGLLRTTLLLPLWGPIGEVVVLNQVPSDTTINTLNSYLGNRWGIAIS